MKTLKILTDLDDTMEEFLPRWVQAINYRHNKNVKVEDVKSWCMFEVYPDLSDDELIQPLLEHEFWAGVQEKPGAGMYIRRLMSDGHDIRVVTSSHYATLQPKMDYMFFRLFPFLTWDNVIVTSDKTRIRGDVIVDDNPVFMDGFKGLTLLMDATHNRNDRDHTRVYNWEEVYDIISSYAESIE